MKKYFIIILFFIASCDPYYDTSVIIYNNTNKKIIVYSYMYKHRDSLKLKIYNLDTLYRAIDLTIIDPFAYDSIIIKSETYETLKYYPSDTLKEGKSFFKEEYWTIENPGKRVYIYTFEINDDDFK